MSVDKFFEDKYLLMQMVEAKILLTPNFGQH
jgi:hypothetical protein